MKVYDYFMWNLYVSNIIKPYTEIEVTSETSLPELKSIFKRDKVFVICFECI